MAHQLQIETFLEIWGRSLGKAGLGKGGTLDKHHAMESTFQNSPFLLGPDLCNLEISCNSRRFSGPSWRMTHQVKRGNSDTCANLFVYYSQARYIDRTEMGSRNMGAEMTYAPKGTLVAYRLACIVGKAKGRL